MDAQGTQVERHGLGDVRSFSPELSYFLRETASEVTG